MCLYECYLMGQSFLSLNAAQIMYLFNISMMLNKCIIRWFWVDVTTKAQNVELYSFINLRQKISRLISMKYLIFFFNKYNHT